MGNVYPPLGLEKSRVGAPDGEEQLGVHTKAGSMSRQVIRIELLESRTGVSITGTGDYVLMGLKDIAKSRMSRSCRCFCIV
jgi:hypothetical protein